MAKNDNLKDFLTDVADAIREKKGTEDLINPQDFSDEIKNLPSGSSPFAVDFGEDVAMQSTEMIDSLKADLEYYYEIERQRAAGEVTDSQLLNSEEFRRKIAWWPKGMVSPTTNLDTYQNLRVIRWELSKNMYNKIFAIPPQLAIFAPDTSAVTDLGMFLCHGSISEPVSLRFENVTQTRLEICQGLSCPELRLELPNVENATGPYLHSSRVRKVYLEVPKLKTLSNCLRNGYFDEVYGDISSATLISYSFYNNVKSQKVLKLKGLQASINISFGSNLGLDSIKYILDNCQAREDGASYTLTLDAAVKTAFLAKCDEDAEYAASLASANAKGLTLA